MKIILDTSLKTDNVTSVVAASEDAEFLDENLLDDFTTNIWRAAAGVTNTTLTVTVSKGSALELLNTNALTCTATLDGGAITTLTKTLPGTGGRVWMDYPVQVAPHTIVLTLGAASAVSAGILRAGEVVEFKDPLNNNSEESKDYSIELELNNGADYYRKRNVVRHFNDLNIVETRANAFKFKHNVFDAVGPQPLAIRLFHRYVTDGEYILFAKRVSSPKLHNIWKGATMIEFDLKEVI